MPGLMTRITPLAVGLVLATGASFAADNQTVILGSGGAGGVYYPVGLAICKFSNNANPSSGVKCEAKTTAGSVANLRALRAGDIQLALAQSDQHYHSLKGVAAFKKDGAYSDLRSLFSLHSEPFTLVARKESGIQTVSDLAGKVVNIGVAGSGHRATMDLVMRVKGWNQKSFAKALELDAAAGLAAFCSDQVDAVALTVGHPSKAVKQMLAKCRGTLINAVDKETSVLVSKLPYYSYVDIRSGIYRDMMRGIKSFGSSATLVSSAQISDKTVYGIVKSIFSNFKKFKNAHQALRYLNVKEMSRNALTAPLHPGAAAYYKEAGLM